MFLSITDKTPLKLIVTLKGEAKNAQSSKEGIYIIGPNLVIGGLRLFGVDALLLSQLFYIRPFKVSLVMITMTSIDDENHLQ